MAHRLRQQIDRALPRHTRRKHPMSAALPLDPTTSPMPLPRSAAADEGRYWNDAVASTTFKRLLHTKRRLVAPLLIASFAFIVTTMLLAGYAKPLLALKVAGAFNLGYLLVLLTYLICWAVAMIYVRNANARFDVQADAAIRALPARRPS
jgi:uncharacterized membrane protein (DUF485 family)